MNSRLPIEDETCAADLLVVAVLLGVADVEVIGAQIRSDSSAAFEDTICFADRLLGAQDHAFMPTPTQARPNLAFFKPGLGHYLSMRMWLSVREKS
jgi:hypothetical protein